MSAGPQRSMQPWRLGLGLGGLYLAQGLIHGTQATLVRFAAAEGRSLEHQASLVFWGLLPWVLKLVWGLLEDRVLPRDARGHARVLACLQLGVALAMALVWLGLDGSRDALLLFVLNLVLSWQDVATDAFAVDHVPADARGRVNGVMGFARALGSSVLGQIVFVALLPVLGVSGFLGAATLALALLGLAPLWVSRASSELSTRAERPQSVVDWFEGLSPLLIAVCLLTLLGDGLISAVAGEFLLNTAGWSLEDLSLKLSPVVTVAELLGFAVATVVVDRLGARWAIIAGAAALGLTWATLGSAPGLWPVHEIYYGVAVIEGLARATMLVGVYALCMAGVDARARATQFLVCMTMINLGPVIAAKLGPKLVAGAGFSGVWWTAAVLQLGLVATLVSTRRDARA